MRTGAKRPRVRRLVRLWTLDLGLWTFLMPFDLIRPNPGIKINSFGPPTACPRPPSRVTCHSRIWCLELGCWSFPTRSPTMSVVPDRAGSWIPQQHDCPGFLILHSSFCIPETAGIKPIQTKSTTGGCLPFPSYGLRTTDYELPCPAFSRDPSIHL